MAKPIDIDIATIHNLIPYETRSIHEDFTKKSLSILDGEFDFMILDFMEDRFDIAQIGDSYVLYTPNLQKSQVLQQFPEHRVLSRGDPEVALLWARSWMMLLDEIKRRGLVDKLILNCGVYCKQYKNEAGEVVPFGWRDTQFAELNTHLINSYHALAQLLIPNIKFVNVDQKLHLGVHNHRWGLGPVHYIDEYNIEVIRQVRELTKVSKPIPVAEVR
jgi:hypothetical protein